MPADLNYLAAAKIGRVEMLQAIFGSSDSTPPLPPQRSTDPIEPDKIIPEKPVKLTPELFDRMFG